MSDVTGAEVKKLTGAVKALTGQVETLGRKARWQTRVGWVFAVALAGVALVLALRIGANQDAIIQIQDRTSNEVLCPLYTVFLDAIRHPSEAQRKQRENATPQERAAREKAIRVIVDGYATLGCAPR